MVIYRQTFGGKAMTNGQGLAALAIGVTIVGVALYVRCLFTGDHKVTDRWYPAAIVMVVIGVLDLITVVSAFAWFHLN